MRNALQKRVYFPYIGQNTRTDDIEDGTSFSLFLWRCTVHKEVNGEKKKLKCGKSHKKKKRVYSHKTSKAIEYMICDVLQLANGHFHITDKIENAKDFLELTDSIIERIRWEDVSKMPRNTPQGDAPSLLPPFFF